MRSQTVSILEGNTFVVSDLRGDVDQYFLVPGTGTVYSDANWSLIRKRSVGDGFHEDLTVLNLVALVQAIGLLLIGGGIVAAIAAFLFWSPATVAT